MRMRVTCRRCGTTFAVSDRHAGKIGRCPAEGCGAKVKIPVAAAAVPVEAAPVKQVCTRSAAPAPAPRRSARAAKRSGGLLVSAILGGVAASVALGAGLFVAFPGGDAPIVVASDDARELPGPRGAADREIGGRTLGDLSRHPDQAHQAADGVDGRAAAGEPVLQPVALVRPSLSFEDGLKPFLATYCADCHGPDYAEADIDFGSFDDAADVRRDREKWERVLAIVQVGAMPPSEMDQPTPEERAAAIEWMDRALHEVNCNVVNDPGRVTVRRLNRAEYDNTVRDLLGIEATLSDDFPSDDVGNGFDNQGDVLTLPPLLLEKYLDAAEKASELAVVGDLTSLLTQRKDGKKMAQSGEFSRTFQFSREGKYTIRVLARADQAGSERARMEIKLDGRPLGRTSIRKDDAVETFERTVPVKAGEYAVTVRFPNDYYNEKAPEGRRDRNLEVESIEVVGPLGARPDDLPESHARIVVATPETAGGVRAAAAAVFRPLATRAFRRPATDLEVERLATLVESAVAGGRPYERGLQLGLQAVLVSPHFLFRIEHDPSDAAPGTPARLNDFELASRLSYFLWSSMPDSELLDLAAEDRLHDPAVLDGQIERMLADDRSAGLVRGFFEQWLNLRLLDDFNPDSKQFEPYWNEKLKMSLRRETELFCEVVVKENLDVRTFLTADFTHVNPRLAEYYGLSWKGKSGDALEEYYADGLPDFIRDKERRLRHERGRRIYPYADEEEFVRVPLPPNRRGILTQGSILALTSNPTATSPVKRGKWILDNVLGTPPPPPPPDVPALEDTQAANEDLSLREALAMHREDPGCASCHAVMDPLGFAFENFDAVGQWREKDGRFEIDAAGELPDGETFDGAVELSAVLHRKSDQFVTHLTRKLMTYALGRGLEWYDRCAVDAAVAAAEKDEFRFRALVRGVVLSDPFQKRRAAEIAAR